MTERVKHRIIGAIGGRRTVCCAHIVRAVGCSRTYVRMVARQLGVRFRRPRTVRADPSLHASVIAMRDAGMTTRQIARAVGVSHTSVHRIIIEQIDRRAGI